MPIYEYCCKKCNIIFETFVSAAAEADKVVCNKCGSKKVEKQFSTFTSRLPGSSGDKSDGVFSGCSSKSGFS